MTQYDAGPGDWSDRPWEDPDRKPTSHARRRRLTLPPWALLAILVGVIIILCVGLILIVKAIRDKDEEGTPTVEPTATLSAEPTFTQALFQPTEPSAATPTDTVALPIDEPTVPVFTEIAPGATVVVEGTGAGGLNLRQEPSTSAQRVGNAKDGTELVVVEGPEEASGYTWWKLRTPDGTEGWGAATWLVLKTE